MTTSTDTAIDPEAYAALEEIADGDREFLVTLIEQYLQDGERLVGALAPALSSSDARSLERAAHTLKSSSANLGAMTLSRLCEELRGIGMRGDLSEATERVPVAEVDFDRGRLALAARSANLRA